MLFWDACKADIKMFAQVDFASEPLEAHGINISQVCSCKIFIKATDFRISFVVHVSLIVPTTFFFQVVYMGLHIVTPLITVDLLKFPKLCHGVRTFTKWVTWSIIATETHSFCLIIGQYFSLLSHLLEVYPEMIAQLNIQAFNHILGTLDFGLHHQVILALGVCAVYV